MPPSSPQPQAPLPECGRDASTETTAKLRIDDLVGLCVVDTTRGVSAGFRLFVRKSTVPAPFGVEARFHPAVRAAFHPGLPCIGLSVEPTAAGGDENPLRCRFPTTWDRVLQVNRTGAASQCDANPATGVVVSHGIDSGRLSRPSPRCGAAMAAQSRRLPNSRARYTNARLRGRWCVSGGEGGIRTHVGLLNPHPISSRRRYDRFGTSPRGPRIL